jgi:excisionase family DNA binding protein
MSQLRQNPPELLSSNEVARRFDVSVRTVHRWAKSGQLAATKLTGATSSWVFDAAYIDQLVAGQTDEAGAA